MTDPTNQPDDSVLDPWTLESLLEGAQPADDAAAPLASLIASARRAGDAGELSGAADALAAFRATVAPGPVGTPTRRTTMLSTLTRSKLVVAATAGALTMGAASAAAYSNVLPDSMQSVAHELINAPSPSHAVGPDATGSAAQGLCTAYAAQQQSGQGAGERSVAFRNLATAAGGAGNVATYCASVLAPTSSPTSTSTDTPTGTSTAEPTGTPTGSPTDSATDAPTTEPTTAPSTSGASARAKGQSTTHPGQGASQWSSHGRTATFPGQGASHWPKANGKPGKAKGHAKSTTTPTTAPSSTPTETATAGS
jgi:hypothetical protein